MPQELLAKFQSKTDFMAYMTHQLQLYVPSEKMLNRDFMKQLLAEGKKLLELRQVIQVSVPRYDELSVKKFWPLMQKDKAFMLYLPDATPDGRLPEREHFWNVLNTRQPEYVKRLIDHANAQRMTVQQDGDGANAIEISEEWWRKLNALPFVSQHKGKTLHLLKKASKAVPQNRKRVQRDIFASPLDFQRRHPDFAEEQKDEEQKQAEPEMEPEPVQVYNPLGHVPAGGGPNLIGNVEDGPVAPDHAFSPGTPQSVHGAGVDETMYVPVTPRRTEAQRARNAETQIARMGSRRTKSKEPPQR